MDSQETTIPKQSPWLAWLVAIAVVTVVSLIGWSVYDAFHEPAEDGMELLDNS